MFNKLVKLVQIDISEKLGGKITDRKTTFTLSLSLGVLS